MIDEFGLPPDGPALPLDLRGRGPQIREGSIVLTSNRGFAEWGEVFADPVVTSAILDRPYHATVINIKGKSFRWRYPRRCSLEDQEMSIL